MWRAPPLTLSHNLGKYSGISYDVSDALSSLSAWARQQRSRGHRSQFRQLVQSRRKFVQVRRVSPVRSRCFEGSQMPSPLVFSTFTIIFLNLHH